MENDEIPTKFTMILEKDSKGKFIVVGEIENSDMKRKFVTYYDYNDLVDISSMYGDQNYIFHDWKNELILFGYEWLIPFDFISAFKILSATKQNQAFEIILKKITEVSN